MGLSLKKTSQKFCRRLSEVSIHLTVALCLWSVVISVEIKETDDGYTLSKVTKNGKSVQDKDTFTVTCLATPQHMESYPAGKNIVFDGEVKDTWTKCVLKGDAVLAKPEDYMTLR